MSKYAVVESGGKQHKVAEGDVIAVEKLESAAGNTIELDKVLLIADGDQVVVGKPFVTGAKVVAKVEAEGRGKKVIVFKYKNKSRYHRKLGHRQPFTRLSIQQIVVG